MVKVLVVEPFHLGKFKELKNVTRANVGRNVAGYLYKDDTFECTEDMAKYLIGGNAQGKAFVRIIERIPEKVKKETVKEPVEEEKIKRTTRRRKSVAKK